jgi:hypothetical protein
MDSAQDLPRGRGCPIRRPADQRALAPPRSFSQRATSFIASWRQGIHQMPLPQRLIAKPVARRDKPRSQQVSHEDALLSLEQRSSVTRRIPALPAILLEKPRTVTRRPRRSPRYSLFTLSKIKNLASSAHAQSKHCFTRSSLVALFCTAPLPAQLALRLPRPATMREAHCAMVEVNGIEPMTSCLQSRRSPN